MKNLMYRAHAELFTLRQKAQDLLKNKSGASMIEYAVLIGLITAAVIATIITVAGKVSNAWENLNNAMTGTGFS
jgi:pilus assembly protein Flp/PilA